MSIDTCILFDDITRTDMAIGEAERKHEADGVLLDARECLASFSKHHFG